MAHRAWLGRRPRCWSAQEPRSRSSTCRSSAGAEVAKELGGSFHPIDVTDFDGAEIVLNEAVDALGGVHIVVNTAGGGIGNAHPRQGGPAPARRVPADASTST